MKYVTLRNVTNGSTAGNGVLCGSAPSDVMQQQQNCGKLGPSQGYITRTNGAIQSFESTEVHIVSLQLAVGRQTRPRSSKRVAPGGATTVESRCVATPN
jgi:hypothetical protein